MIKMIIISSLIVLFAALFILPVVALSSITNLGVFSNSKTGPNQNIFVYTGPNIPGDTYDFGNCTWWVAYLKIQQGKPIPNTWGNAITWASRAMKDGYLVDQHPEINAIMQDSNALGGEGHVALVTNIDQQGNWTISEMNRVGFDEVDSRTLPESSANQYNFIHDKD